MKLVVKPPSNTTTSLGRPVHSVVVPAAAEASPIGLPAVSANEKQALMMPENVATRMPLVKLNSAMAFFFSASGISRSLVKPGHGGDGDADQADHHAEQGHLARGGGGDLRRWFPPPEWSG